MVVSSVLLYGVVWCYVMLSFLILSHVMSYSFATNYYYLSYLLTTYYYCLLPTPPLPLVRLGYAQSRYARCTL